MKCVMCVFAGETWAVPVNTGVLMPSQCYSSTPPLYPYNDTLGLVAP